MGTNTAASVAVVAMTAKPISWLPRTDCDERRFAHLRTPMHVLEHDDRIVDDETDREHETEQRQHVDRVAEGVHHRE